MSWEDNELLEIERLKRDRARNQEKMQLRERMRREQCAMRWNELREQVRSLVATFNVKAGRTLLKDMDAEPTNLHICREDGAQVHVEFCLQLYSVKVVYGNRLPLIAINQRKWRTQ